LTPGYLGNIEAGKEGNKDTEAPSDEEPVNNQCRFCQKCFASRRTLRIHQRLHTGEELFKCKMCGKSLATKQALEIHERIHTGERPYVCRYCNKGFSHKGNLKTHYVVHMK
jgi:KRAB domain-containing zinc finger protein